VLVQQRPGVAAILDTATPQQLAAAMYSSQYFTGNSTDPATNINAYATLIANHANTISPVISTLGGSSGASSGPARGPAGASATNKNAIAGGVILAALLLVAAFRKQRPPEPEEVEA
jgi:hypothetical protein